MNVLDLFSGIGGFSLGLERAGFKTVAFCEIDAGCRRWLHQEWPDVKIYEDIRTLDATGIDADVVCGGFPCQPFSSASAGKRRGVEDDRYLWPEMRRVIQESKPTWVIGENVTHLDGLALEYVLSDLEGIGYEIITLEIPACAVGADHWRARLWILGHAHGNRKSRRPINAEASRLPRDNRERERVEAQNGIPASLDELRAYGNAVVPQIPEIIGRAIMQAEKLAA